MTNICAAAGGSPSRPVTSGRLAAAIHTRAPTRSSANNSEVPTRNSGTASPRYHQTRRRVLVSRLPRRGQRIGGSSRMNSERSPGRTRAASQPTRNICDSTTANSVISAANEMPPRMPMMVASCAEQGIPSASSRMAISRSFGVPRILVVIVAMVSQPRPRTIGRTALPFSPITRKMRSQKIARRGM